MMILNTGTAGAGKSLFTLVMVEARRIADNKELYKKWVDAGSDDANPAMQRDVYYFNININKSKLPWIKLDKVDDWFNMPSGSIFVFDECQEAFEPMANSATRPKYYTELSKHRHKGFDLYFITQHPTFVDTYVRKNVEEHNHFMRPFGAKMVNKHTWKGVKDSCDKSRTGAITERLSHPTEVYSWYKSSEVHTHKFKLPTKVKMLFLLPVLLGLCVYFAYGYFAKKITPAQPKAVPAVPVGANGQPLASAANVKVNFDVASFKPRFDDIPWSAPRYDELTQPTVAPRIVGCMVMQNKCKCMTQQGTYYHTSMQFCKVVIENGIFNDFEDGRGGSRDAKSEPQQTQSAQSKPVSATPAALPVAALPVAPDKAVHVDSGFNLPVKPPADKYQTGYTTQQSGVPYYQKIPAGGVMYRGQ
jgi:zona occludens toxin